MLQITSKNIKDSYALPITDEDFVSGGLKQDSNINFNLKHFFDLEGCFTYADNESEISFQK